MRIPQELTRSVLGARLSAAIAFVSARVHGSRRAVEELLEEVLGAPLALGTVMAIVGSVCFIAIRDRSV